MQDQQNVDEVASPTELFIEGFREAQNVRDGKSAILSKLGLDLRRSKPEEVVLRLNKILRGNEGAKLQGFVSAIISDPRQIHKILGLRRSRKV